jgi:hypothetical protein
MKTFTLKPHFYKIYFVYLWAYDLRTELQLYTHFYHVWSYNMVIRHYIVLFKLNVLLTVYHSTSVY